MTNPLSDGLFEPSAGAGRQAFEQDDLSRRTDFQSRAARAGADFKAMAMKRLTEAGAIANRCDFEVHGFPVDAEVAGSNGRRFLVLARGTPDEQNRGALRRTDTVEKVGFMAMQLARRQDLPILLITSDLPGRSTMAGHYLAALSTSGMWCPTEPIFGAFSGCEHTFKARSMLSRLMHPGGSRTTIMCRHCSTRCGPTARRLAEMTKPRADSRPRAPATGGGPDHRAGRRGSGRFPTDNDPAG